METTSSILNGYTISEQNVHWNAANGRHRMVKEHPIVRVNSLKKHYHYSEDEAWAIVNRIEGLGHYQTAPEPAACDVQNNYIVMDLNGTVTLTGSEATSFVKMADTLGISRDRYRLFVEVYS